VIPYHYRNNIDILQERYAGREGGREGGRVGETEGGREG